MTSKKQALIPKNSTSKNKRTLNGNAGITPSLLSNIGGHGSIPTKYATWIPARNNKEGFNVSAPRFYDARNGVPGPGSYSVDVKDSNPSISSKGYGYGFVSKAKRWYELPGRTFNPPGPGTYELPNSIHNYNKDERNNNVSLRSPRALSGRLPRMKLMPQFMLPTSCNIKNPLSILAKDPRSDKIIPSNLPGPGSYNPVVTHNSLTEEKGRREEYGIFKSNTKRIYETREKLQPMLKAPSSSTILRNTRPTISRSNISNNSFRR